jgi:hypothetical protein
MAQQSHVHFAIGGTKKHISPQIAALCDVMRLTHRYDPTHSRHASLKYGFAFRKISHLFRSYGDCPETPPARVWFPAAS